LAEVGYISDESDSYTGYLIHARTFLADALFPVEDETTTWLKLVIFLVYMRYTFCQDWLILYFRLRMKLLLG
jgi:hypothetical protein